MSHRGDKTRSALLEVATRLFSERGFAGVSTRDIVSAAGATLPSISHHFGSKEGLYRAVLQNMGEQMGERFSAASTAAFDVLAQKQATHQQRLNALMDLLSALTRTILQSRAEWAALITQEEMLPTGALRPVDQVMEKSMLRPIMLLIASLRRLSPANPEVKLQAVTIVGQVLIFRTRRSAALRLLNWSKLTPAKIEKVVDLLRREVRSIFDEGSGFS